MYTSSAKASQQNIDEDSVCEAYFSPSGKIWTASANSREFRKIQPQMYIEDLLW